MKKIIRVKRAAFTLVELIIVLVLIGILISVGVLRYTDILQSQRENLALSNLSTLKSAVQLYQVEHDGNFPTSIFSASGANDGLDHYIDEDAKKTFTDPDEPYKYSLTKEADKLILRVMGPGSFKKEIIITK